jgi:tRNA threonylcarbamoyladenosine biosynthesis protein TsaE
MDLVLDSLEDTSRLARQLAACLVKMDTFPAILLQGDLGSGKTTLTSMLIPLLPGGDQAEVSSPSFTVMNIYPTKPETVHFDFYRTEGMGLDGTMEEYIYDATRLCIAEWIDYLPEHLWPDDHLLIRWSMDGTRRRLSLTSKGPQGNHLLEHLGRLNQAASS